MPTGRAPGPQTAASGGQTEHTPRSRRRADHPPDGESALHEREQLLDPLCCQMALHPGITLAVVSPSPAAPAGLPVREDLQSLLTGLARRVAWGGDRRKGSARIELSEGVFAGATLVVHTEQRSVSVEIELPSGGGVAHGLQQRLQERLEGRGFAARVRIE